MYSGNAQTVGRQTKAQWDEEPSPPTLAELHLARPRRNPTLPGTSRNQTLNAADGVVVLSSDSRLLDSLHKIAAPHTLHVVSREADLARLLLAGPAAAVIIDSAAALRFPLDHMTRRLKLQNPKLALIVLGIPGDQSALGEQIARGAVQFLPKSAAAERLKPLLDAVLLPDAPTLERPAPFVELPQVEKIDDDLIERRLRGEEPRTRMGGWVIGFAVLVTGGLVLRHQFTAPAHPVLSPSPSSSLVSSASSSPSAPATASSLPDLLAQADAALAAGRFEQAVDQYRRARQLGPRDLRVARSMAFAASRIVETAQAQLADHQNERAQQLVQEAAILQPGNPQILQLAARISATPAAPAADAHPQIDEQLRYAAELMRQGHLVDPPRDNARSVLRLARELAPGDPRIGQEQRQLLGLLIVEARKNLALGHPADAAPLIAAATEMGARPDEIDELTRQAQKDQAAARTDAASRLVALFNERMQQGRLLDPAGDSAKDYFGQLLRADPAGPSTQIARTALGARLLAQAQTSLRQRDFGMARRALGEAREAGADAAGLASVEADLQAAAVPGTQAPAAASTAPAPPSLSL